MDDERTNDSNDAPGPPPGAVSRTLARHPRPLGGDTARSRPGEVSVPLTGMILQDGNRPTQLAIGKKPDWLRARMPGGQGYLDLKALIDEYQLHTVCQEASCPNMGECLSLIHI